MTDQDCWPSRIQLLLLSTKNPLKSSSHGLVSLLNILKLQRLFFPEVAYGRVGHQDKLGNLSVRRLKFYIACVRGNIKTPAWMNIVVCLKRGDQIHCVTKRREKNFTIMVPADGEDGTSSLYEGVKTVLDDAYTGAQLLRTTTFTKEIARDDHDVNRTFDQVLANLLQRAAQILVAWTPSSQHAIQMPIRCMQDFHVMKFLPSFIHQSGRNNPHRSGYLQWVKRLR